MEFCASGRRFPVSKYAKTHSTLNNPIYFRPSWIPTVLMLVLVPLFVSLGLWQVRRADEKQSLMQLQQSRSLESPVKLLPEMSELGEFRYRPVVVSGNYDTEHQILLDNQVFNGQAGYHVVTPLRLQGGRVGVLVNRGWVPMNPDRRQLPGVPAPAGPIELTGTLDKFAAVGLKLKGADIPSPGWPAVVQIADADRLRERLGYPLLPYQVLLAPAEPGGFDRAWRQTDLHPEKSRGYALQWFAFAATTIALYFWYGFKRKPVPFPNDER